MNKPTPQRLAPYLPIHDDKPALRLTQAVQAASAQLACTAENLLFSHPDVVDAVVTPVPHPIKGLAPAAMVVVRDDSTATAEDLKAYCLQHGSAYSHPRFIHIVAALPLNGAGKIDRGAAQAMLKAEPH